MAWLAGGAFAHGTTYVPPVPTELRVEGVDRDIFDRSGEPLAQALADEHLRLVVVFVGRSDSPPSTLMRKVGWCDRLVLSWAADHARVLYLGQDRGEAADLATAGAWRVERVPTTIVFRDGVEIDRAVGYRRADRLLEFLEGAASGDTTSVRFERSLRGLRDGTWEATPSQRLLLARDLLEASRLDEARVQFEWLWEHMVEEDPTLARVRLGPLVLDLQDLCERHEPSREAFAEKREAIETLLKDEATRTWPRLGDWLALNRALRDDDRSLAWFDRLKVHPDSPGTLERVAPQLEPILEGKGEARAAEIILLYATPEKILRRDRDAMAEAQKQIEARRADDAADAPTQNEAAAERLRESRALLDAFQHRMGLYFCTLLRSGREEAAGAFAAETKILAIDGGLTKAIADEAITEGVRHTSLADLLDSAKRLGQDTSQSETRLRAMMGR